MRLRHRVHEVLDPSHNADWLSRSANWIIYSLIFLNVVSIVLESVPSICRWCPSIFQRFEEITVIVFTIEYLLRLWTCVENPRYASPVLGRLQYLFSPMALIDALAIVPFYMPFIHSDWVFLRSVRFVRLFRVAKLGRYSSALRILGNVVHAKRSELLVALFVIFLLAIFSATGMYYAENEAQPGVFPDIPTAIFWAIAALTNVGHTDPITSIGKVLASIISILGIGMFALPTGILGAGFVEEFQNRHKKPNRCPHCGKDIEN